ncbi:MAG: LLM class F420-dependent oxidoreductase [Rhodospirillaceae bacterium]|jgi:probable F420-dependent oxidoreductase|nr:LLM class F420-dependent oxidoreductase [Rhodospirillaceae bacterium]MBT5191230.1 LLM class F420-dependent oxidoreductase [Rhodospirillaceae bacterium]MBT5897398.1 LLM class F420-dependent oxidoreductase [Rhodospirillaceae bacterium]MBT6429059.1 LLM class F420-dependent oxidoreductase [Rhodospirillaceae bacterium]MBT7755840.1 LLM class F420-dependent oxidoreductase [Rhodospirillaceae bacterium]
MQVGVVFPQTEIGSDPLAVRDYAQAAEGLNYSHILAFDHVLGANRASRPNFKGPYDHDSLFHEPFVLYGYLAGLTEKIGLTTGIIIVSQRQTVLVAKQAAAVDVLSGGRLRLGIGVGWNDVEFEGLGENFRNRGKRSEEQVEVLRALWTQATVTYDGKWHKITDAGINPLPVQQPIPILFGGMSDAVMRRLARLGDGWLPQFEGFGADGKTPNEDGRALIAKVHDYIREAGRDPSAVDIEGRVKLGDRTPEACAAEVAAWSDLGATHVTLNTMGSGLSTPAAHIDAIRRFKEAL